MESWKPKVILSSKKQNQHQILCEGFRKVTCSFGIKESKDGVISREAAPFSFFT